ncbi:MAG TPA: LysM domain-containing protein [Gammaproteobacteria bacterium]|jgi:hypothetical protein|nr:LysM domain-containing protein [Gammaproteobacteria bacterium]
MNDYNAPRYLAVLLPAALLAACVHAPKRPTPIAAPQPATVSAPAEASAAPAPTMQPAAPQRYTVKKGDTLWGIASIYLKQPWAWPDIWYANPAIKNPHLIYPGDVLILGYTQAGRPTLSVERNGEVVSEAPLPSTGTIAPAASAVPAPVVMSNLPVTKLEPQIHYEPLDLAVTTVPLDGLRPFLSKTRIVSKSEMEDAGYLMQASDAQPAMGADTEVYARDLKAADGTRYGIYHLGDPYVDPESGDTLGYEATYVGEATVQDWGDPQKVTITSTAREARAGDRFLAESGNGALDLSFPPHRPAKTVNGQIVSVLSGEAQIGQYDVVVLNRGSSQGIDPGTVLGIYRKGAKVSDPLGGSVTTPIERSGTLMVFRSFDKASYAVVMLATREIHVKDVVANP